MSTTAEEVFAVFKSMGAEDGPEMQAAFALSGTEREMGKLKEGLERVELATEGLRADFKELRSEFRGLRSDFTDGCGEVKSIDGRLNALQMLGVEMRGEIKLLSWMIGIIILTTETPLLLKVFGH